MKTRSESSRFGAGFFVLIRYWDESVTLHSHSIAFGLEASL